MICKFFNLVLLNCRNSHLCNWIKFANFLNKKCEFTNQSNNNNEIDILSDDENETTDIPEIRHNFSRSGESSTENIDGMQNNMNDYDESLDSPSSMTNQMSDNEENDDDEDDSIAVNDNIHSNQSACFSLRSVRDRKMLRKRLKFYKISGFFCARIQVFIAKILYKLIYLFLYITRTLEDYTHQDSFVKAVLLFPREIIVRLFCFSKLNFCRRINVHGILTLPPRDCEPKESDSIFTPCQWPIVMLVIIFTLIALLGCHHKGLDSSLKTKYMTGTDKLIDNIVELMYDFYSIPGLNCVNDEPICITFPQKSSRWIYCMVLYPYVVTSMPSFNEHVHLGHFNNFIKNLSDWRLKRNLKRLTHKIRELRTSEDIVQVKLEAVYHQMLHIEKIIDKRLEPVYEIERDLYKLENEVPPAIKEYEKTNINVDTLIEIQNRFKNMHLDIYKCIHCGAKSNRKDMDKMHKNSVSFLKHSTDRINKLTKRVLKRPNVEQDVVDELEKVLTKIRHDSNDLMKHARSFDSILLHLTADINNIKKMGLDRIEYEAIHTLAEDHKIRETFTKSTDTSLFHMTTLVTDLKSLYKSYIMRSFKSHERNIRKKILRDFCHRINDLIKTQIISQLKINLLSFYKCSIYSFEDNEHQYYVKVNLKTIENIKENVLCHTTKLANKTIENALINFDADHFNKYDYALQINGAKIIESNTENLNDSNWSLNNIDQSAKAILNSRNSHGQCWNISKSIENPYCIIELAEEIYIGQIVIDHIELTSFDLSYSDAPKNFEVYTFSNAEDNKPKLLGNFSFILPADHIQVFNIKNRTKSRFIALKINSNHGNPDFTCMYRFRVFEN